MTDPIIALTRDGKLDDGSHGILEQLRVRLAGENAKVLLHVHGGLVTEASGVASAMRLSGSGDESWNLGSDWTQLYLVWRTGFVETWQTNWKDLAQNDRFYKTVLRNLLKLHVDNIVVLGPNGWKYVHGTRTLPDGKIEIVNLWDIGGTA